MIEILLGIIIAWLVGTVVIHISVSFAGVEDATLKKAFVVALIGALLSLVFGYTPLFGIVIMAIAVMVLIRVFYLTTWVKAFVAAIVYIVVNWIVNLLVTALLV